MRLAGPVTLKTIFDLQQAARTDAQESTIIDLARVPYADSAGLGAILGVMASCQRHGKSFAVAGASERIKTLFRITRIEGLLHSTATVDEALKNLPNVDGV